MAFQRHWCAKNGKNSEKKIRKASLTLKMSISRWNFSLQHRRSELQLHIWRLHKVLRHSFSAWSKINDVNANFFLLFRYEKLLKTRLILPYWKTWLQKPCQKQHEKDVKNVIKNDVKNYVKNDVKNDVKKYIKNVVMNWDSFWHRFLLHFDLFFLNTSRTVNIFTTFAQTYYLLWL